MIRPQPAIRAGCPFPAHRRFRHDVFCPPGLAALSCPVFATGAAGVAVIRRIVTLGFCALAFWAGMKLQQARSVDACLDAGGAMRGDVLCTGVAP